MHDPSATAPHALAGLGDLLATPDAVAGGAYEGLRQVITLQTDPCSGTPWMMQRRRPSLDELAAILESDARTLYASRPLLNASDLIAWARESGFTKTLRAEDIHVTFAFSKAPLVWPQEDDNGIHIPGGDKRSVKRLGNEGAIVLRFDDQALADRWKWLLDAGASWDHPGFQPHVTFTLDDHGVDLNKLTPYAGPLDFGPEVFKEVGDRGSDWADKARASMVGDEFSESDHPRASNGEFGSGGGKTKMTPVRAGRETDSGASKKAALAEKVRGRIETIKKHGAEAREFAKGKSAAEVVAAVAANHKFQEKAKEGLSVSIQFLINHASGFDASTWTLTETAVEHAVQNLASISGYTAAKSRQTMIATIDALIAARKKLRGGMDAETDEDGVTAILELIKEALEAGGGDEEDKPAATDSALSLALDRDSVREVDRDGRLRVGSSHISKATVNPYWGREIPDYEKLGLDADRKYFLLRDPEELAKAAPTFNGVQLLRKHIPVNADDHQPYDVVGSTGTEAAFTDPYLDNSLSIWARDAIDGIESEQQCELSCGYHYRADMTAGIFRGMRYDGVMRDIVGNHVALVPNGRAGPDVVVGDSAEGLDDMSTIDLARKMNAIAARQISFGALNSYLRPRLAMDKSISLAAVFDGVPVGPKFKDQKPVIANRLREQTKGMLALDTSLQEVEKVIDMLEKHEMTDGVDTDVSGKEHAAIEAAAAAPAISVPDINKDAEPLRNFLKEKGMGEDDINAACGMLPKPATDEAEETEEEKKKKKEEADKKAAEDKAAKDAEMDKDKVTKTAMDEAIKVATDATRKQVSEEVRATERGIRMALDEVRPWVGELPASMAFDSGEAVMRHALVTLGVDGAKTLHKDALKPVLMAQQKPGARPSQVHVSQMGMDSATVTDFQKMFPGADRFVA